jgi:RNA polymerase sigma-70 factor (sigma-E family)
MSGEGTDVAVGSVTPRADDAPNARALAPDDELASLSRADALYRLHYPAAVRLAYLLTGDAAEAQDIAQDAFLAAAPRVLTLRSPEAFGGYLRRTVTRRVLMRARAADREARRVERATDPSPDTDDTASVAARLDLVGALNRLPVKQRTALVLRYWSDLSEDDIAALLRCRRGTVKSTLSRALLALRRDLADHDRL